MPKNQPIMRVSDEALKEMLALGGDKTDWARVKSMPQEEVERLADAEDGPLQAGWEDSITLGIPEPKQDVHIRLDQNVLRWFKAQGPGYQTRINAVLRAFVETKQRKAP